MKYLLVLFGSISLISIQAFAHPHMFVDVQPSLISVKSNKITLSIKWFFDEFTSGGMLIDYDQNANGNLDKKELKVILRDFGDNLKKYNYFLKIMLNGKKQTFKLEKLKIKTKKIISTQQSIGDIISKNNTKSKTVQIIYYEFNVIVKSKLKKENQLEFSFYDPTNYSVLYPKDKTIINKAIKIKSNHLVKTKCLFKVGFSL